MDVEIPLIQQGEIGDASGDGMVGPNNRIGGPVRIDGVAGFVIPPDPFQHLFSSIFFGHLHRIVNTCQAHSFFHEPANLFKVV